MDSTYKKPYMKDQLQQYNNQQLKENRQHARRFPLVNLQFDVSEESYAESSKHNLTSSNSNKHYLSKTQRDIMELRRIQLHNLPTYSSESSVEEIGTKRKIGQYMKRKSKLESDLFWSKYNQFLIRSIDYRENYKSSSSDS